MLANKWRHQVSPTRKPLSRGLHSPLPLLTLPGERWVLLAAHAKNNPKLSTQHFKMTGRERWSLLDGEFLRRRRSVQSIIDHYLNRLVDIFDFPVAPPSSSLDSLPASLTTTRKYSASVSAETYTTMDDCNSPRSHSRECTIGSFSKNSPSKTSKDSLADRVRKMLLRSTGSASSRPMTRKSVAICGDSIKSNQSPEPRELRMSWIPVRKKNASQEPQDDLWIERDEQDRQLECGYKCLPDEATI
ncbi:unnamed protein product [Phytophthora lilii]|uniref:Unnamed protein product n=1 Tax=Phytophthora lilii TaxID=2077276 RepID=A0A9W6TEM0_9STRA|nr:unnamed protein product [Phytophthora lilii]